MFLLLNVFLFYSLILWKPCTFQYSGGTAQRLIGKLNKLTAEVVKDAEMKIESIQHLKRESDRSKAFHYGHIVYQMRYRYKRMVFVYNKTLHQTIKHPDGAEFDSEKHVDELAEMDNLAHDILVLVEMIEMRENKKGRRGNAPRKLLRTNEAKLWENLAESEDQPTPSPIVQNGTKTGKRRNGVWHYAVPNIFNK